MQKITEGYLKKIKIEPGEDKMIGCGDSLWMRVSFDRRGNISKRWYYRHMTNGKAGKIMLGLFPDMTMLDARNLVCELQKQARSGVKPTLVKPSPEDHCFQVMATSWLEKKKCEWGEATYIRNSHRFDLYINPLMGKQQVNSITVATVDDALKQIYGNGKREIARRCLLLIRGVLQHARTRQVLQNTDILTDLLDYSKNSLPKPPPVRHLYEGLTDDQIGELLIQIDASRDRWTLSSGSAMKIAPYLFVRPSELCSMRWDEINFETRLWRIPASKMKMRRDHIVPLPRQVISIINELRKWNGNREYVFFSQYRDQDHIHPSALLRILRRLGYSSRLNDKGTYFTTHGFRGMATTILYERFDYPAIIVELQMAHVDEDKVRSSYNCLNPASYIDKRVEMVQRYADFLDELREKAFAKQQPQINPE